MAKKKQDLSLEELLEEALVPESEQPYEVPDNWVWSKLSCVANWGSGGTPSRKNPEYYYGNIPWIKTGELDNGYIFDTEEKITDEAIKKSSAKLFPINTVVIAMYGATIGKVGIMGVEATTNQACACGIASMALNYLYLFYYALSQKENFIQSGKGGAQPNISQEIIKAFSVPLPPLAEQQRIVVRIESLFEKLDQAKGLIQDALDSFENRKAAILHKAFTGELTKKWREEKGVGMDSWHNIKLPEVCELKSGTTLPADQELSVGKIPYVKVADMNLPENQISITLSSRYVNECKENHLIPLGSTIFPKRGGAIFTNKRRILLDTPIIADLNIMAIIPDIKYIKSMYCFYWFLTIDLKELNNGSNVPQINNSTFVAEITEQPLNI